MSRYTGPRVKIMRALGTDLPGLSPKKMEKRPYPPGQHGHARKKLSEFALRLQEKQKLRKNYGITEKQLRGLVVEAGKGGGPTGHRLIELLERRFDNVVFRAGFARTIPAARQLVNHGHLLIDGKRVDIASFRIRKGMKISFRPRSQKLTTVETGFAIADTFQTPWLTVNRETRECVVTNLPDETAILFPITVQLVIEYYSQRL